MGAEQAVNPTNPPIVPLENLRIIDIEFIKGVLDANRNLVAKCQYLLDWVSEKGILEKDGAFTFPDGETWFATKR